MKRGKILAEIFWGKWEMVFEWATVISNSKLNWLDNTREWVPQSSKIYLSAIELCNSEIENNILLFPVFITFTQLKLSLSDENRERKSSQTLKIVWVPHNSQTQSYDSKQPNPNRALFTPDYWLPKSISSLSFQEHHGLASYGPSTLFGISFPPFIFNIIC